MSMLDITMLLVLGACWCTTAFASQEAVMCEAADGLSDHESLSGWTCSGGVPVASVCQWTGVGCNASLSVTSVDISDKDLRGAAPSSLLTVAGIETVQFAYNDAFAAWLLPNSPASSLKYVNVANSNLGGTVPATEWCALTELHYVNVGNNDMTGAFPVCLLEKAGMKAMYASHNDQFSAWLLPSSPASSLKVVSVYNTNLGGSVPAMEWCALTGLDHFQVGNNDLTGAFPVCLLEKAGMQNMHAHDNDQFSAWLLPSSPASSLKVVSVYNSNLGGTVPPVAWCVLAGHLISVTLGNAALSTALPLCAPCPRSNYREEGISECVPCPTGMYTSEPGAISVDRCRVAHEGTFVATAGAELSYCAPGTYGHTLGGTDEATSCLDCSMGTFSA